MDGLIGPLNYDPLPFCRQLGVFISDIHKTAKFEKRHAFCMTNVLYTFGTTISPFSDVFHFKVKIHLFRQNQHDAVTMETDEEDENEAEVRRSSSAELARCQECTGCLDMCFGLFLMLAYVVIEYMPQLLQKDRYKTFH